MALPSSTGDSLLERFYIHPSLETEKSLFDEFCRIDQAHLAMLVRQGMIPIEKGSKLATQLRKIRNGGIEGLNIDPSKGSLLFQIEATIAHELSWDIAGILHTARSRIDQRATARRLAARSKVLQVMQEIINFQEIMIAFSEKHLATLFPYYTHMQQAQPGSIGHYFLAFVNRFQDDFEDCQQSFAKVNLNPLGTAGRCGTSWPIDRNLTTTLLGFDGLIDNSMLGRDPDYAIRVLNCLSMIMSHLYDFATDLHIWSTQEFNYIALHDSHTGISSIFPNKKNPVLLETIRSEAGAASMWVPAAYTTCRGEGTGDHNIHNVPHLVPALDVTSNMLELAGGSLKALKVNISHIEEVLSSGWTTTSNLADKLVQDKKNSLNFRQAHHIVQTLIAMCKAEGIDREAISPEDLSRASLATLGTQAIAMGARDLKSAVDPRRFVESCVSTGGVAPPEVNRMLAYAKKKLEENWVWLISTQERLVSGNSALDNEIEKICGHDLW
ncbi:hypothetical protein FPOAC2_13275 [Fusarium poae]